jgi:oligosaccharide repeat unit polymerase
VVDDRAQPPSRFVIYLLAIALIVLVALFPAFWREMLSLADPRFRNIWWGIRSGVIALSEVQGQKSWQLFFYDNITVVAILLALLAMVHYGERGTSRLVAWGLLLAATLYNLATASRAGAATVLVSTVGIRIMQRGRVSFRHVIAGLVAVVVMYVPLTLLRAGDGDPVSMAATDLKVVSDGALLYTLGPLTAFDAYLASPTTLPDVWSVSYFFLHAANRMGFDVSAPSTHVGYVLVGPNSATNVYTMYFAYYPEFGWIGVIGFSAAVGYLMTWLYQAARAKGKYLVLLYGIGFSEICVSGFNEGFFMALNLWIKAAAFCLLITVLERMCGARRVTRKLRSAPQEVVPA